MLLTNGSTSTDCAVEALNAIYDTYSGPVFIDGGYLEVSKGLVKIVSKMISDQRLRADEAYENLIAS
ncbi:1426_t:CDS:2 [Paraglomus brasilianum]|uniref:1426_t:CDS:1 n=1 Tax=Paraglomus brasilianum TaxID=144538 RepID=A0A9N9GJW4_9GLOM|nr:1426_t:CDS:2 [Paraglomus brasilianum]